MLENTPPEFSSQWRTNFDIEFQNSLYTMPVTRDNENNSEIRVYLDKQRGLEELYPFFVSISEDQGALKFRPKRWNIGHTYYFAVILNEESSNSVSREYTGQVTISNDKPGGIGFSIPSFKQSGNSKFIRGKLRFSEPIDVDELEPLFSSMM